jgi:hypothetical protein
MASFRDPPHTDLLQVTDAANFLLSYPYNRPTASRVHDLYEEVAVSKTKETVKWNGNSM